MIQQERITALNERDSRPGRYVLYWMQAAQRAEWNHALEYAIERANKLKLPVVVGFGLTADFPEANLRHYHFMLQGLKETQAALAKRGIRLVVRAESPTKCIPKLAKQAALLVVDEGYLQVQDEWREAVAEQVACRMEEVQTNLIVPVEEAAEKENFSAGTFRPRISRKLDTYLVPLKSRKPRQDSLALDFDGLDLGDIDKVAKALKVDTSVGPAPDFEGGAEAAERRLRDFIEHKLDDYDTRRNDPNAGAVSNLSPYLHFGQISPLHVALEARAATGKGKDAFLEELIVRRELSFNLVYYNRRYDDYESLPPWALRTLNYHARDKREYLYSLEEFETARTHDPYWNAAQQEMVLTGKMHGYMRMYWGKKILEWSKGPQEGFRIALYLNNKYELDGRDPNGFAGVAWCFGRHDRAWAERSVFGKVRYMNAGGLRRKFDADAYVSRIDRLAAER